MALATTTVASSASAPPDKHSFRPGSGPMAGKTTKGGRMTGQSDVKYGDRELDDKEHRTHHDMDALYQQHQAELVHYLQGNWQKSEEEASDIVQHAFERFMCLAEPHKVEQPRAYLFQLVRNLTVDQRRKQQVRDSHRDQLQATNQENSDGTTLNSPERSLLNNERLESLQTVIEKLPAKRRRAFILSRVHQLSYQEIANDMGISVDGVKKHVMRALETCQSFLAHKFEE